MDISVEWRRVEVKVAEGVSVEIRPLRVDAFMALMSSQANIGKEGERSVVDGLAMLKVCKDIFPDHVRNIYGIHVNRGQDSGPDNATIEDLVTETALINVAADVLNLLFEISQLTEMESKNLENPSGNG